MVGQTVTLQSVLFISCVAIKALRVFNETQLSSGSSLLMEEEQAFTEEGRLPLSG